jgi:hypothetical protein
LQHLFFWRYYDGYLVRNHVLPTIGGSSNSLAFIREHDLQQQTFQRGAHDLKPGAPFRIQTAERQPDGTYTATSISVGKDGGRPF